MFRYLPARLSWAALSAVSTAEGAEGGGPELGLPCELALAEMRVDRALSLTSMQQRQQQEQRLAGGGKSNSGGLLSPPPPPPVGTAPPASTEGGSAAAIPAVAAAEAVASAADGGSGSGKDPTHRGVRGGRSVGERPLRRSEYLAKEAAESLAIADGAILQLEPWFVAVERSTDGGSEEEGGRQAGTYGADSKPRGSRDGCLLGVVFVPLAACLRPGVRSDDTCWL